VTRHHCKEYTNAKSNK